MKTKCLKCILKVKPVKTVQENAEKNNFQRSISFPLILAQILGFFPVDGLKGPTYKSLKFKWKSWRMLYTIISIIGFILSLIANIFKIIFVPVNFHEINGIIFHLCAATASILLVNLAREWPAFVKEWYMAEVAMKYYEQQSSLCKKLAVITTTLMTVAAVEHVLVQAYKLKGSFDYEQTTLGALRHFFVDASYPHIFSITEYSLWKGLLIQNLQMAFSWSFVDVFIILICVAFTSRLKQITRALKKLIQFKVDDVHAWRCVREDFNRLFNLCTLINARISYLVLLSFFTNVYFLLVQLFSSLRATKEGVRYGVEKAYWYMSFVFLIVRLVCVCIYAGEIYEEYNVISPVLHSVSSKIYNSEIDRFLLQLKTSRMTLTGLNFFTITRGLILKISGAIVTYELVLIQFNGKDL